MKNETIYNPQICEAVYCCEFKLSVKETNKNKKQHTLNIVITFPITLTNNLTACAPDTKKKSHKNKYSRQALSSSAKC